MFFDIFLGLRNGTLALYFFEIEAIFFESVLTTTSSINLDCLQTAIVYAINGCPFTIAIFLFFIDLDPNLAGIIATIFIYQDVLPPSTGITEPLR